MRLACSVSPSISWRRACRYRDPVPPLQHSCVAFLLQHPYCSEHLLLALSLEIVAIGLHRAAMQGLVA